MGEPHAVRDESNSGMHMTGTAMATPEIQCNPSIRLVSQPGLRWTGTAVECHGSCYAWVGLEGGSNLAPPPRLIGSWGGSGSAPVSPRKPVKHMKALSVS